MEQGENVNQFFVASTTVIALVSLVALIAVVSLAVKAHANQETLPAIDEASLLGDATKTRASVEKLYSACERTCSGSSGNCYSRCVGKNSISNPYDGWDYT